MPFRKKSKESLSHSLPGFIHIRDWFALMTRAESHLKSACKARLRRADQVNRSLGDPTRVTMENKSPPRPCSPKKFNAEKKYLFPTLLPFPVVSIIRRWKFGSKRKIEKWPYQVLNENKQEQQQLHHYYCQSLLKQTAIPSTHALVLERKAQSSLPKCEQPIQLERIYNHGVQHPKFA